MSKQIYSYYKTYCKLCKQTLELKEIRNVGRKPNFPEVISEALCRKLFNLNKPKNGDATFGNLRVEIKCFSSKGPISFGPTESWDILIVVNAIKHPTFDFHIFHKSHSDFHSLKINKHETFVEQCSSKRRPRISP